VEGGGRGKGSIEKRKVWGKENKLESKVRDRKVRGQEESKGDRKISWKGK